MLPNHNYEVKKIMCMIAIKWTNIHTYPNDCVLYKK